ncbi:MAG: ABC transporter permease [Chloroflexota bacterium]
MVAEAEFKGKRGEAVAKLKTDAAPVAGESLYQKALKRFLKDWLAMAMLVILAVLVVFSIAAPVIEMVFNVSYTEVESTRRFLPIGSTSVNEETGVVSTHVLGTDDLGRDQFARLAYGGRVTLIIAFSAALISLTIGILFGVVTGYFGGIVDDIIMWMVTTLNSVPTIFLLIIVAALFRPGALTFALVLGFLGWTGTTRLVRGETLGLREREFVIGARSMGASDWYIMNRHIVPNLISIVVITLALDIGSLMLTEAALSFLGLGVQPPVPTWGNMLSNSREFFRVDGGWHLAIFPGLLITISVLCLYVIGDGVRDAFDPMIDK